VREMEKGVGLWGKGRDALALVLPSKNLGGCPSTGDLITTNDTGEGTALRILRVHGARREI